MRIVFLGTGGSFPTKERNVGSVALQVGGDIILFDCGEGTQRQLLYTALSFMKIKRIYISHLHGDHFFGLPGLIQTMGLNQRDEPLEILGPQESGPHLQKFLEAGFGFHPFEIKVRELPDWHSDTVGDLTITNCYVTHSVPTLAIAVQEKERRGKFDREKAIELGIPPGPLFSKLTNGHTVEVDGQVIEPDQVVGPPRKGKKFVYCGDTAPCESIKEIAKDADVLVYESTFAHELEDKAKDFKHSTNVQAAHLAKECNVKHLILNHLSPRYSSEDVETMLKECREVHPETYIASDLDDLLLTSEGLKESREKES
jgi:ribonuclease Z